MIAATHVQAHGRRSQPEQEIQRAIAFTIPGDPVGWARARSNGKVRFTAPKQSASLEQIGLLAKSAMQGRVLLTGPVAVAMHVTFAYPASWPKRRREAHWYHTSKPDLDNLAKQVCDGISGIAFKDDAQVSSLECAKTYGDAPSVEVKIESLGVGYHATRLAKQGREAA